MHSILGANRRELHRCFFVIHNHLGHAAVVPDRELHGLRGVVAVRRSDFLKRVGLAGNELVAGNGVLALAVGLPGVDDLAGAGLCDDGRDQSVLVIFQFLFPVAVSRNGECGCEFCYKVAGKALCGYR